MSRHALMLLEGLPYRLDPRVRAQAAALRDAGWDVTVASPDIPGDPRDDVIDGIRLTCFRTPPGGRGAVGYLREYGLACIRLAALARAVDRERPVDLVLACAPPDFLVAVAQPLAWRGAAVVLDQREISPELLEAKFGRRPVLRRLLLLAEHYAFRRADAVITVSEAFAELARERSGADPARVFLVGNGPDPGRVHPVAPRPELRRGRRHLVLWLGRMSAQERLETLVDAAEEVVRRRGRTDVHFAIVGDGDVRAALTRSVTERGLEDFVEMTGSVDDALVRAYICTADVCVGVDERNSMNDRVAMRKVLEYMALGKAVVQFPLAEMRRLCGDACAYARDGDASDLAAQVCALLDDRERRRRLGEAARRRAWDGLMWPQQVPALLGAVDAALARRSASPASGLQAAALRLEARR